MREVELQRPPPPERVDGGVDDAKARGGDGQPAGGGDVGQAHEREGDDRVTKVAGGPGGPVAGVAAVTELAVGATPEGAGELPTEQRECLIMRFLQGLSIAETALALDRSDGAVKQLQLRGVRNLAKLLPEGLRDT